MRKQRAVRASTVKRLRDRIKDLSARILELELAMGKAQRDLIVVAQRLTPPVNPAEIITDYADEIIVGERG